jgi:hypothetical protein
VNFGFLACFRVAAIAVAAALLLATPASAAVSDFVGVWNNTSHTAQIRSVSVRQEGDQTILHVWVGCSSRSHKCDWGEAPMQLFPVVSRPAEAGPTAFLVQLDLSSAKVMLVGHLNDDGSLNLMTFLIQSNSNQTDWWANSTLSK